MRHSALVRVTHWVTVLAFLALLLSGVEILISHPQFYWGETGNVNERPWIRLPIPSSRATIPNGYGFTLPDQNGWSRYLHFEAAWALAIAGALYAVSGFVSGHFRRNLLPAAADLAPASLAREISRHLRPWRPKQEDAASYNVLQRLAYLAVVFVLIPLMIWTGLALAPAFAAVWPGAVAILGGRQSARTLHFIVTGLLVAFVVVHLAMVVLAGFRERMRAIITGRLPRGEESA